MMLCFLFRLVHLLFFLQLPLFSLYQPMKTTDVHAAISLGQSNRRHGPQLSYNGLSYFAQSVGGDGKGVDQGGQQSARFDK